MAKQFAWNITGAEVVNSIDGTSYNVEANEMKNADPDFALVQNDDDNVPILVNRNIPDGDTTSQWTANVAVVGSVPPFEFVGPRPPHR